MNNELKGMLQSVLKDALMPIHQRLDNMEKELKEIKSDVNAIKLRQDSIKEENSAIHYNQESTNATLKALAEDVNYMKGDICLLKEGQLRQEKILEKLALRSIEQETEILELKRIK